MPLSRPRSRPRVSLLRSQSATNAASSESDVSATSSQDDRQRKLSNDRQRSSGGWSLPTLSTLANFNFHRRGRAKSEAKRKSLEAKAEAEAGRISTAGSRDRDRARDRDDRASPREPSPNSLCPPATVDEPTSAVAAPASLSLHPSPSHSHPNLPSTVAVDTDTATIAPSAVPTSTPDSKPDSSRPVTPSKPHSACPRLVVQRPSTPTVPTLDSSSCSKDDKTGAMQRKIWVRRAGASATRVEVAEDDLVDNVRDVILRKYANSLGRSIDSPDIILKIISREQSNKNVSAERALGPEEPIGATLDAYYPGGQNVDEALVIDVPVRRTTPRVSPRPGNHHIYYYPEQYRPDEAAREYFPPMQAHSPHLAHVSHSGHPSSVPHSMAVLTTGQLPPLPSPGSHGQRRHARPKYGRQHTSSPTILHTVQPNGQVMESKAPMNAAPSAPPLPTPPAPNEHKHSITPPNRVSSPHPGQKPKKRKGAYAARSTNGDPQIPGKSLPAASNLLDGTVPPINVLLVEDNVINLKLLEAFMKRLKVRWSSAMNGKEAVSMWRKGGFHLVLMDIQLPVMNGLEATKEIRRLEAVNGIGVFSGSPIDSALTSPMTNGAPVEADALPDRSLFKSPVIIVALTASSLQSDRHEALAAGCNDFLTKPVNFVWMERKVTEWGCMQALIDFDGWRKWKQYAEEKANEDPAKRAAEEKEEKAKAKAALRAMMSRPPPSAKKDKEKDKDSSTSSTTNIERATTPVQNGTPKKGGGPGAGARSHKSSRSNASGTGMGLESMAEEDENKS